MGLHRTTTLSFMALLAASACGGSTIDSAGGGGSGGAGGSAGSAAGASAGGSGGASSGGAGGSTGGTSPGGAGGSTGGAGGALPPVNHRATATPCDHTRPTTDPGAPSVDAGFGGYIECRTHAECTAGENGRCVGNGHDGWHCTYDECFADSDCAPTVSSPDSKICQCEGGFRSDANVCLGGNCRVDADCGAAGYCSPTLGSCGNYTGTTGYYCHTPADECVNDTDCTSLPGGYCAYDAVAGHWKCSNAQCVG